jgi:single-strand DNA-binding protein
VTKTKTTSAKPVGDADQLSVHRNEIVLVGRLAAPAHTRSLPSGDILLSWRLVVDRPAPTGRASGRTGEHRRTATVDTLDCVAFRGDVRRASQTWVTGDILEVRGALRRRFWRGPTGGPASRCEVEAQTVTRLRKMSRAVDFAAPPTSPRRRPS